MVWIWLRAKALPYPQLAAIMQRVPRKIAIGVAVFAPLLASGCDRIDAAPPGARLLHRIEGFDAPESVRYDPDQDLFFVSNIVGFGSVKDSVGYLSRIDAAELEQVETFIQSGVNGAMLHAPKGMALQGDTLWVADIDVLRAFDRRTGVPLATVDLASHGAVLLNDIALGPDGRIYVTDTGIEMSPVGVLYPGGSKILSISGADHAVRVVAEGPRLAHPNGITWDSAGGRWLIVTFHPFRSEVYALSPGQTTPTVLARGRGRFDGIELLADGRMLVTSWSDSSVHELRGESDRQIIRNLWQPADPGVDTRRGRLVVPLVLQGRVEVWEIPPE